MKYKIVAHQRPKNPIVTNNIQLSSKNTILDPEGTVVGHTLCLDISHNAVSSTLFRVGVTTVYPRDVVCPLLAIARFAQEVPDSTIENTLNQVYDVILDYAYNDLVTFKVALHNTYTLDRLSNLAKATVLNSPLLSAFLNTGEKRFVPEDEWVLHL